ASSRSSGSGSLSMSMADCSSSLVRRSASKQPTTGASCEYSTESSRKRSVSLITSGSASSALTSSARSTIVSSLRCSDGFTLVLGGLEQKQRGLQQRRVAAFRGLAQVYAGRVDQRVGQCVSEVLQDLLRIAP